MSHSDLDRLWCAKPYSASSHHSLVSNNRPSLKVPESVPHTSGLTHEAVPAIQQEWTQAPQQAARRVSSQSSSDDQADTTLLPGSFPDFDFSLALPDHSTFTSLGHLSHPDFLGPDPWSQHIGCYTPSATGDNPGNSTTATTTTTTPAFTHHDLDLMTFGQTWADSGEDFAAAASSLNDYDFTFDPSLMTALPDTIPDFFLVAPRQTTNDLLQDQQHRQQLENLSLDPPPVSTSHTAGESSSHHQSRTSSPHSDSNSPSRVAGAGRASKRDVEDPEVVVKRQRNTIAARKYRQKRLDRIQELEEALKAMTGERDDLRLRLARQEAETAALREMMQMKKSSD